MRRVLDLFCGAGGASAGYVRAGFEVVGVDIVPQPHYPYPFIQADALEVLRALAPEWGFTLIHASPHLVGPTRDLLKATGLPYVIENVGGAPLLDPVMLCGSMFGLGSQGYGLRRHRFFEATFPLTAPGPCAHVGPALPVYGHAGGRSKRDGLVFPGTDAWREGMDIDWMTGKELAESIPPAFTEWIGRQLP